jgi:hypothetical protein
LFAHRSGRSFMASPFTFPGALDPGFFCPKC